MELTPELIKKVQAVLIITEDQKRLKADGKIGPETQAALRSFQRDSGLKITKVIDEPTIEEMKGLNISLVLQPSIKERQAFLILLGHTDEGNLIADGIDGEHMKNAIKKSGMSLDDLDDSNIDLGKVF